ncbi:MAG: hypothetical protein ACK2U6_09255 [Candidatus Promineifilaceae bacterium]
MSGKYRILLAFWFGLFIASVLIIGANLQPFGLEVGSELPSLPIWPSEGSETEIIKPPIGRPECGGSEIDAAARWSLLLAGVSALISAAGFMTTTYFALRSDRRQTAQTELEVQSLALEIERQRLEIDRLRRLQQNYPAAR